MDLGAGSEHIIRDLIVGKIGQPLAQTGEYGVSQRLRLFVDFFQHEMGEAVFHGGIHVPVYFHQFRHLFMALQVVEVDLIGGQTHDMVFRDDKILSRIRDERR